MALKLKGSTSGFVAVDCAAEGGNNTLILPDSNGVAGAVWANNVTTAGVATCTSVTINKNGDLTVPGTVSVGGTITYEDVTNVDSVGIITARTDIHLGDKLVHYGDTNTAIRFPAADTITAETGGSERLRIDSGGSVGIGTDDASWGLSGNGGLIVGDGGSSQAITIFSGSSNSGDISFGDATSGTARYSGLIRYDHDTDYMAFRTATAERMRITSDGKVGIGTDNPASPLQVHEGDIKIQNNAGGTDGLYIRNATSTFAWTGEHENSTIPNGAIGMMITNSDVATNKSVALAEFRTYRNSASNNPGGVLIGAVDIGDGSAHSSDCIFALKDGSATVKERLRITHDGLVGIGTDAPENDLHIMDGSATMKLTSTTSANSTRLILESEADSYAGVHFGDPSDEDSGRIRYYHGGSNPDHMAFSTAAAERLRINSTGLVGIGLIAPTEKLHVIGQVGGTNPTAGSKWDIARFVAHDYSPTNSGGLTIGAYWNNSVVSERTAYIQSSQGTDSGSTSRALLLNPVGGNIGIGTDAPDNRLHIWGASPIIKAELHPSNTGTDQDCFRAVAGPTGNSVFNIRAADASSDNSAWVLKTNSNEDIIFNIGGIERVRIDSAGLVGMGTDSPSNRLHVASTSNSILFVESYDTNSDIIQADTGGSTRIRSAAGVVAVYGGGDAGSSSAANCTNCGIFANSRFGAGLTPVTTDGSTDITAGLIQTDGNIDIRYAGTNSDPAGCRWFNFINSDTSLVNGQPCGGINWIGNDTSHSNHVMGRIYGDCAGNSGAGVHFKFDTDGSQRFLINNNGDIGAPSGDNIYDASDERLKENVVDLTDGLSKVKQLKPVSYNYKSGWNKDTEGKTKYGFGAQTTQAVDELLVEPFSSGDVELNGETIENPIRVNEKFIIPLLVKAIQEQQEQIETLKAEVAALKGS